MWKIFFFIILIVENVHLLEYRNYEVKYKVKITTSNTNDILVNDCLITTTPSEYNVPKEETDVQFSTLFFDPAFSFCTKNKPPFGNATAVLTTGASNCGLIQQIHNARQANIKLLVLVSSSKFIYLPYLINEFNQYPIITLMPENLFYKLENKISLNNTKIGLYGSMGNNRTGDVITGIVLFSVIIISMIFIIVLSLVFNKQHFSGVQSLTPSDSKNIKWIVLICPIVMVGTLLLLYFFYNVFVWVFMIMFYFAAAFTTTSFVMLFVIKFNILPDWTQPINKYGVNNLDYRAIGIFAFGLVLATSWIVNRNNSIGLVLNNIIGVLLCGEIAVGLATLFVATKNFRLLVTLLTITLVIDVLMVYIPAPGNKVTASNQLLPFMKNDSLSRMKRESVMELVATGNAGSSKEEIPIRFKIPYFNMNSKLSSVACQNYTKSYSMVGFGDVILPGSFIAYILTFAVMTSNSVKLYSIFTLLSYISGLVITYLVVQFSGKGQPALVFLLPSVVPTTILLTLIKKDFKCLWYNTWLDNLMHNTENIDDEELIVNDRVVEIKHPL